MREEEVRIVRCKTEKQLDPSLEVEWNVSFRETKNQQEPSNAYTNLTDYELWKLIHESLGWNKLGESGHSTTYAKEFTRQNFNYLGLHLSYERLGTPTNLTESELIGWCYLTAKLQKPIRRRSGESGCDFLLPRGGTMVPVEVKNGVISETQLQEMLLGKPRASVHWNRPILLVVSGGYVLHFELSDVRKVPLDQT